MRGRVKFGCWTMLCIVLSVVSSASFAATATKLKGDFSEPVVASEPGTSSSGIQYAPGMFDGPTADDLMVRMLSTALGDPVYASTKYLGTTIGGSGGGVTVLTQMIALTPGLAVVVAGLMTVYTLFGGLINSGRDGQFLGRKWDSWWVPFRTGVSVGSIYPCPGFGGLAFIQVAVLALALFGIGIGSAFWRYAADKLVSNAVIMPESPSMDAMAKQLLEMKVCSAVRNYYHSGGDDMAPSTIASMPSALSGQPQSTCVSNYTNIYGASCPANGVQSSYADSALMATDSPTSVCGVVTFKKGVTIDGASSLFSPSTKAFNDVYDSLVTTHKSAFTALDTALTPIAKSLAEDKTSMDDINGLIVSYLEARNAYRSAILTAVNTAGESSDFKDMQAATKQAISKGGFAMAGSYIFGLTKMQDGVLGAIQNSSPSVIFNDTAILKTNVGAMEGFKEHYARAFSRIEQFGRIAAGFSPVTDDVDVAATKIAETNGDEVGKYITNMMATVGQKVSSIALLSYNGGTEGVVDPLLAVKAMGNAINDGHLLMMGVMFASNSVGENWASQVATLGSSKGMGKTVSDIISGMLPSVFALGFLFSNIIPALPYIMWFMALMGYLTYVLEALLAAPFWVSMHTHPEGHEVTGHGSSGYPILLTLVLRPPLMIIGLVFAMGITRIGGWFLSETLVDSLKIMNQGGFNYTALLGYLAMFGIGLAAVIYKSYSLTYELPNAMLRWMGVGAHHQDLGEAEGSQRTNIVAGRVGSLYGSIGSGGPQQQPGGGGQTIESKLDSIGKAVGASFNQSGSQPTSNADIGMGSEKSSTENQGKANPTDSQSK